MPYTVPKLTDFSAAALDNAVRELLSALEQESAAAGSENDWKALRDRWMARKSGILIQSGASSGKLAAERLDVTLPGIRRPIGAEHPVIKTMNEIIGVFRNLGYT